jgi:hypothetical protein
MEKAAGARPGMAVRGELLAVGVLHDEGFLTFLDRPGRREAAGHVTKAP